MNGLSEAIRIAATAHEGERDKGGMPYILHPLRVMLAQESDDARIVAVLHDVVEDSEVTLAAIASMGFSPEIVTALDSVTRREGETYMAYVQRAGANPIGRAVKIADLLDNLDPSRPTGHPLIHAKRQERYRKALAVLDTERTL